MYLYVSILYVYVIYMYITDCSLYLLLRPLVVGEVHNLLVAGGQPVRSTVQGQLETIGDY